MKQKDSVNTKEWEFYFNTQFLNEKMKEMKQFFQVV